jgi:ribosomal protein L5
MKKVDYKNLHQVPAVEKIVLNSGFSAAVDKNHVQLRTDVNGTYEIRKITNRSLNCHQCHRL